jgi:hypothetical protein
METFKFLKSVQIFDKILYFYDYTETYISLSSK